MKKGLGQLAYTWKILWHPIDGFYELRFGGKGSIFSATVLYAAFYICNILHLALTNFVFNVNRLDHTSPFQLLIATVLPFLVWVMANYLVSSITKGQGTLKSVYISTAYALAPYIVFSIPLAILSNIFTNAEKAIYDFLYILVIVWTGFMLYLQVKEVHGYEIFEAFGNILWTIFTMAVIAVFGFALYGITVQSLDFIVEFAREVFGLV